MKTMLQKILRDRVNTKQQDLYYYRSQINQGKFHDPQLLRIILKYPLACYWILLGYTLEQNQKMQELLSRMSKDNPPAQ